MHGYAIAQTIHLISDEVLRVEEGSLYPALYRLELDGAISAEWGLSENNRKAKYYAITKRGRYGCALWIVPRIIVSVKSVGNSALAPMSTIVITGGAPGGC